MMTINILSFCLFCHVYLKSASTTYAPVAVANCSRKLMAKIDSESNSEQIRILFFGSIFIHCHSLRFQRNKHSMKTCCFCCWLEKVIPTQKVSLEFISNFVLEKLRQDYFQKFYRGFGHVWWNWTGPSWLFNILTRLLNQNFGLGLIISCVA